MSRFSPSTFMQVLRPKLRSPGIHSKGFACWTILLAPLPPARNSYSTKVFENYWTINHSIAQAGLCWELDWSKALSEALMKEKSNLVLCPCLGVNLARPVWGWDLGLKGVNFRSWELGFPPGKIWSYQFRDCFVSMLMRYSVFFLFNIAWLVSGWFCRIADSVPFFPGNSKMLYFKFAWLKTRLVQDVLITNFIIFSVFCLYLPMRAEGRAAASSSAKKFPLLTAIPVFLEGSPPSKAWGLPLPRWTCICLKFLLLPMRSSNMSNWKAGQLGWYTDATWLSAPHSLQFCDNSYPHHQPRLPCPHLLCWGNLVQQLEMACTSASLLRPGDLHLCSVLPNNHSQPYPTIRASVPGISNVSAGWKQVTRRAKALNLVWWLNKRRARLIYRWVALHQRSGSWPLWAEADCCKLQH